MLTSKLGWSIVQLVERTGASLSDSDVATDLRTLVCELRNDPKYLDWDGPTAEQILAAIESYRLERYSHLLELQQLAVSDALKTLQALV